MKKVFLQIMIVLLVACFSVPVNAQQDTAFIHRLLERIERQQVKQDNFFMRGIFPAYINKTYQGENYNNYSIHEKDNNIFFTSLILYSLQTLKPKLDEASRNSIDRISLNSTNFFSKFRNQKGRGTYNFWRTDSAFTFPYNNWVTWFTKSWQLPDDMDCTAIRLMLQDTEDAEAAKIHLLMQQFAGYPAKKVKGIPEKYKIIPTYSTWFGKNFPVFYDVCVASNVLSFVQRHQLGWTKADTATVQFLVTAIETKDYMNKANDIAPYYIRSSVILYHLARLMAIKPIPELDRFTTQLVTDAVKIFSQTNNMLEKIILSSAIQKFGYQSPPLQLPPSEELFALVEQSNLPFFVANMASYFDGASKKLLSFSLNKLLLYNYYCPAYNDALLLEYHVLNN